MRRAPVDSSRFINDEKGDFGNISEIQDVVAPNGVCTWIGQTGIGQLVLFADLPVFVHRLLTDSDNLGPETINLLIVW